MPRPQNEKHFFFLWGKNKWKRQHVWKVRRTSTNPFYSQITSWFRMRPYFCVWVKVKHIQLINNPFYRQAASWFCMKHVFAFGWKWNILKHLAFFFLKTDTTLKSNLFAKKVNSCECFVVLHQCFTYADAFINRNNLKSQKFSQWWAYDELSMMNDEATINPAIKVEKW